MDLGEPEIQLTMPGKLAIYHRNNFYAYINAWKHEAIRLQKKNVALTDESRMIQLEHAIRMDGALRKYLVVIDPEPNADLQEVELRFIRRDLDERQANYIGELDQMITASRKAGRMSFDEVKERLQATPAIQAVDGKKVIEEWKEMAGGPAVVLEELDTSDTTEEDIQALSKDPPVRDDLSDLITESNQPGSPTQEEYQRLMTEHLIEKESEKKS
jgi:hypothetical protein